MKLRILDAPWRYSLNGVFLADLINDKVWVELSFEYDIFWTKLYMTSGIPLWKQKIEIKKLLQAERLPDISLISRSELILLLNKFNPEALEVLIFSGYIDKVDQTRYI